MRFGSRAIFGAAFAALLIAPAAHALRIRHIDLLIEGAQPFGVAVAPDGTAWVTEKAGGAVVHVINSHNTREFELPTRHASPSYITAGPDGNMWFTETDASKIARVTPGGAIDEFPTASADAAPVGIAAGSDGNLWYTARDRIGRMTPLGDATEFPLDPDASGRPWDIAAAPDGALWFTLRKGDAVQRISTLGEVTAPVRLGKDSSPAGIAFGLDGTVWATATGAAEIAHLGPTGLVHHATPSEASEPAGIALGPFGELWVTEHAAGKVARVTNSGLVDEYDASSDANSAPTDIAVGPGNTLWFTEAGTNRIGTATIPAPPRAEANLPPPSLGRVVDVGVVSGTILVARPGAAPKKKAFRTLRTAQQIQVGSYIDARHGTVRILAAGGDRSVVTSARATGGLFQLLQVPEDDPKTTEMRLRGGDFTRCKEPAVTARRRKTPRSHKELSAKVIRRLKVWAHGRSWKTGGNKAFARGIGTSWVIEDQCGGTSVKDPTGEVEVVSRVDAPVIITGEGVVRKTHRRRIVLGKGRFRRRGKFSGATVRG